MGPFEIFIGFLVVIVCVSGFLAHNAARQRRLQLGYGGPFHRLFLDSSRSGGLPIASVPKMEAPPPRLILIAVSRGYLCTHLNRSGDYERMIPDVGSWGRKGYFNFVPHTLWCDPRFRCLCSHCKTGNFPYLLSEGADTPIGIFCGNCGHGFVSTGEEGFLAGNENPRHVAKTIQDLLGLPESPTPEVDDQSVPGAI